MINAKRTNLRNEIKELKDKWDADYAGRDVSEFTTGQGYPQQVGFYIDQFGQASYPLMR